MLHGFVLVPSRKAAVGDPLPSRPRLRDLFDAGVPGVAVSFADDGTGVESAAYRAAGMDVAELRIDLFADRSVEAIVGRAREFSEVPTIATIRSSQEGGAWDGDDADRLARYEAVAPLVDALDIEASSVAIRDRVIAAAQAHDGLAIVSFHDFVRTPPEAELTGTIAQARDLGADVVKVATMTASAEDRRTLARVLTADHGVDLIVIGMGAPGVSTRLLFPFLGSKLTFAAGRRSTAPGQLPLDQMVATLASLHSEQH